MINYEICFLIAVFAFVYACILTEPNMLLNPIYVRLDKAFGTFGKSEKHWVFKLLIHCEKCIAGQIALWYYLIDHWYGYEVDLFFTIAEHLFTITMAIFMVCIIKNTYTKYINNE